MTNTTSPPRVLLVDDEPNILKTVAICLEDFGFDIVKTGDPEQAWKWVQEDTFDMAFLDLKMSPIDGMALLREIKQQHPQTIVVIITAHGAIDSAVEAIKHGAYDYLQKPFDFVELQLFAAKLQNYFLLNREVDQLRAELARADASVNFMTENAAMREMLSLARRIAPTGLSVLIEGESGTGKELIARIIHERSDRADKPHVKVNCAAIPEHLLESELFGHVKGAFTGAVKDRVGRFEMADGGTIFLDEIGEIPPGLQAKLLRVLQEKEFERVGESKSRQIDIRITAATNRNLEAEIEAGNFREDLFYRLNAVRLKLLPLRDRPEDLPMLIHHMVRTFGSNNSMDIAPEARKALMAYHWKGNVRELENVIERAVLLSVNGQITLNDLPAEIAGTGKSNKLHASLEDIEKAHIKHILSVTDDLGEAAKILGIDPATLWRKRKKYGL